MIVGKQPQLATTHGTLEAIPPFDFAQSLKFLGAFQPSKGEQTVTDQALIRATRLGGQTIAFRVTSSGSVDAPRLDYTLYSREPVNPTRQAAAEDRISHFLSLRDDLTPFYALAQSDPVFAGIVQKLYGYHQVKFLTPFEGAVWALLSSRNTFAAARTLKNRLTEVYGDGLDVEGTPYPAFPEPEDVLPASPADLVGLIRNEQRGEYIWHAARAFALVDDPWLRTADYDEVYRWLRDIRGIGEWSASFILIRSLGRMERLIAPEKRLLESTSEAYGRALTEDDLLRLAEPYGDYKAYWSHYLRAAS